MLLNNTHSATDSMKNRQKTSDLVIQLSHKSTPYDDPLNNIQWDLLNTEMFWLPQEAISLYGTAEFDNMSEQQRKKLSHVEFVNFVEAGLWLESLFMERIGRSLRQDRYRQADLTYHLHELREEAGHSLMFVELINRSQLTISNQHFKKLGFANLFAKFAPFNGAMFWLAVLIGEQVPDNMNRFIRHHRDNICQPIVDIVSIHIHDEARHIAHAKSMINSKLLIKSHKMRLLINLLINKMFNDFISAYYFPPNEIYQQAGLSNKISWNKLARQNPHRQQFVSNSISSTINTIEKNGIKLSWAV